MDAREQKQLSRSSEPSRRRLQRRRGPRATGPAPANRSYGQAANLAPFAGLVPLCLNAKTSSAILKVVV